MGKNQVFTINVKLRITYEEVNDANTRYNFPLTNKKEGLRTTGGSSTITTRVDILSIW